MCMYEGQKGEKEIKRKKSFFEHTIILKELGMIIVENKKKNYTERGK